MNLRDIPLVRFDGDPFKFIVAEIAVRTQSGAYLEMQIVVRGASAVHASLHRQLMDRLRAELDAAGFGHAEIKPLGGGFVFDRPHRNEWVVSGDSGDYGRESMRGLTVQRVQEAFPHKVVRTA